MSGVGGEGRSGGERARAAKSKWRKAGLREFDGVPSPRPALSLQLLTAIFGYSVAAMARTDFTTPRLCVDDDLAEGARSRFRRRRRIISSTFSAGDGRASALSSMAATASSPPRSICEAQACRAQRARSDCGRRSSRLTSTICSRRSNMRGSTIWRRRRWRWARSALQPVHTRRTQARRVNLERLRANAREACEQCGVIWLPEVAPPLALDVALRACRPSGCWCSATRTRRSPIRCRARREPDRRGSPC